MKKNTLLILVVLLVVGLCIGLVYYRHAAAEKQLLLEQSEKARKQAEVNAEQANWEKESLERIIQNKNR